MLQDKDSTVSVRQKMNCAMVGLWATRLSCFLFWRVLKSGEDKRFRQAKQNSKVFFSYWLLQGGACSLLVFLSRPLLMCRKLCGEQIR